MKLTTLNEQPRLTYSTKEEMWQKLANLLEQKSLTLDNFEKTSLSDIFKCDERFASLYIHYTKKDGITAYMFFTQNAIHHKGKTYPVIQQKETLNYKNIFTDFTLTIFKEMNKQYKRPVLSDDKNSNDMKIVFTKWFNDPEKYGLKNYFVYDSKTKKTLFDSTELEHDPWTDFENGKRYTLVFDFFDTLKEAEDYNSRFKGTPLESKLYYSGPRNTPPETTFT